VKVKWWVLATCVHQVWLPFYTCRFSLTFAPTYTEVGVNVRVKAYRGFRSELSWQGVKPTLAQLHIYGITYGGIAKPVLVIQPPFYRHCQQTKCTPIFQSSSPFILIFNFRKTPSIISIHFSIYHTQTLLFPLLTMPYTGANNSSISFHQ